MPAELAGKVREAHGPVCAESSFQYYWGVDLANIPLSDSIFGSRVFQQSRSRFVEGHLRWMRDRNGGGSTRYKGAVLVLRRIALL